MKRAAAYAGLILAGALIGHGLATEPAYIEVPGPIQVVTITPAPVAQPTPQIVEIPGTVIETTPDTCIIAIMGLTEIAIADAEMLIIFFDNKEPTLRQLDDWEEATDDYEAVFDRADECVDKAPTS